MLTEQEMNLIGHFIESDLGGWEIRCNSKDAKIYKKFDNLEVIKVPEKHKDGRNYNVSMVRSFDAEIEADYYRQRYEEMRDEYASLSDLLAKEIIKIDQALRNLRTHL